MFTKRLPLFLRHAPAPGMRGFALLAGVEAMVRGMLVSVMPLAMYRALGDAGTVSSIYFVIGVVSLTTGLMVPWLTRFIPRRWMYTLGACCYLLGNAMAIIGGPYVALAAGLNTVATVVCFVCFNAYVLDYIAKSELGRTEATRILYSALAWTIGPVVGVWLLDHWYPLPFLVSGASAAVMLVLFWIMRLGNGKLITKARAPAPNPLAFLGRFFAQPRLIAGWLFAVIRSCGWWVYVVYLPIFAVEAGLGDKVGGITLSLTNAMLFATPMMLRWMQRSSIRHAVRVGFLFAGLFFTAATALSSMPWFAVAALMAGSVFLVLLDIAAGLPFLMAVKPSERTEMSAVYSSFRDVSGILTPGGAWFVLLVAPLPAVFVATGGALLIAWGVAGRLHPRLGAARVPRPATPGSDLSGVDQVASGLAQ